MLADARAGGKSAPVERRRKIHRSLRIRTLIQGETGWNVALLATDKAVEKPAALARRVRELAAEIVQRYGPAEQAEVTEGGQGAAAAAKAR